MGIEIPRRLNDHLLTDDHWYRCVTTAKSKIELFLSESPLFFPDYTGHGIEHINQVLIAADKLIRDDAFPTGMDKDESSGILEPMDLAYLICAIMIHDMGMFLKKDGAENVINSACGRPIPRIGDDSWKNLWQDYFDSTSRSTQSAMRRQFGKVKRYSADCFAMDNMGEDERRFIGEFLRRHHGRLAHEIALRGLPGSTTIDIFDGCDLSNSDRDMIGILARSHTMEIRDTESYLKANFEEGSMPENTPVFFLMSVLRIADLLDAGNHRAPELLLAHQRIYIPASEKEWTWNQRIIQSKCRWNLKNKNRSIYAEPKCSVEYVQLDKWLKWVQSELDLCWSILAERYPDGYRLSIHRVTSRIHQPEYYKKMNETFLPREVMVSANPEITQLLIAPLYGDDPSFGVRELLQNAVDACEERRYREPGYKGLVTVRIDPWIDPATGENRGVFTIEDNGVGMNEHVLLNYYLSAGSSYRNSEEWKKEYTVDGRSQVARTGKFGIGFLAAFLLGDEIEVHTQHMNDDLGYKFSFTNEAKPLNVERVDREEGAGTTIRIILKAGIRDNLFSQIGKKYGFPWFNWYVFDDPEVRYSFDGKQIFYEGYTLSRNPLRNRGWFELKATTFDTYLWNPNPNGYGVGSFHCNGIRIYGTHEEDWDDDIGLGVSFPAVSIIDSNENLDIDLTRSRLEVFPFERKLLVNTLHYHIARLLLTNWDSEMNFSHNISYGFLLNTSNRTRGVPFLLTPQGFLFKQDTIMCMMGIKRYRTLFVYTDTPRSLFINAPEYLPDSVPVCIISPEHSLQKIYDDLANDPHISELKKSKSFMPVTSTLVEALLLPWKIAPMITWLPLVFTPSKQDVLVNILVHTGIFEAIQTKHPQIQRLPKKELNGVTQINRQNSAEETIYIDPAQYDPNQIPVIAEHEYRLLHSESGEARHAATSLFAQVLRDVLEPAPGYDRNDIWIPFDMEERKKKFPKAFRELKVYLDAIERDPEAHHMNI